jgi:hypothetical protein
MKHASKQISSKSHVNWGERVQHYASGGFVKGFARGMGRGMAMGRKKDENKEDLFPEAPKDEETDIGLYRAGGKIR